MPSAIFYLGRRGLTIEKFNRFVKPHLEDKGYSIYDVAELGERNKGNLLVSLSAEKHIFEDLNQALKYAVEKSEEYNRSLDEYAYDEDYAPDPYSIEYSEVAVQFRSDDSATKSFEKFYQDYLTTRIQARTIELTEETKKLTRNIDTLEKRVQALANTSLSQLRK